MLCNELTAINQYFLHYRMYKHWGYKELAEHEYKESIDEMKHADRLIERILFLEGLPNLQKIGKLLVGEGPEGSDRVRSQARKRGGARSQERDRRLRSSSATTSAAISSPSILESEEEHIDWLETQLGLVDQLGVVPYLQTKVES